MSTDLAIDYYGPDEAESYRVGQTLPLTLADGSTCTATVLKAFLPLTQSLVLLVSVEGCATLVHPVVLKIYDPRYMKNRKRAPPNHRPWSLEVEIAAATRRDAVVRGERVDGHETDAKDDEKDEEDEYEKRVLFEEKLYGLAKDAFERERTVYERLHALQGDGVARCYASGTVRLPSPDKTSPRPIQPPLILIEYLHGQAMNIADATLISRALARRLLHTLHYIQTHGVAHSDLHQSNIIFTHTVTQPSAPPNIPFSRAVVIDFGQAGIRDEPINDEEWENVIAFEGDFHRACKYLHDAGIRYESPLRPEEHSFVSTKLPIMQAHDLITENSGMSGPNSIRGGASQRRNGSPLMANGFGGSSSRRWWNGWRTETPLSWTRRGLARQNDIDNYEI
jgi:serine/threonine protein kinase